MRGANGDLEGAQAAGERALELDPQSPVVLRWQILRWGWTHEPERALAYADELLRVDPLSPQAYVWAGYVYERLGRFAEMERTLDRIRSMRIGN